MQFLGKTLTRSKPKRILTLSTPVKRPEMSWWTHLTKMLWKLSISRKRPMRRDESFKRKRTDSERRRSKRGWKRWERLRKPQKKLMRKRKLLRGKEIKMVNKLTELPMSKWTKRRRVKRIRTNLRIILIKTIWSEVYN